MIFQLRIFCPGSPLSDTLSRESTSAAPKCTKPSLTFSILVVTLIGTCFDINALNHSLDPSSNSLTLTLQLSLSL